MFISGPMVLFEQENFQEVKNDCPGGETSRWQTALVAFAES